MRAKNVEFKTMPRTTRMVKTKMPLEVVAASTMSTKLPLTVLKLLLEELLLQDLLTTSPHLYWD